MNWVELLLILGIFIGITAAAFMVARSPTFWVGLVSVMIKAAMPFILKRMPPEEENAWRKCILRGGTWDYRKKKCK